MILPRAPALGLRQALQNKLLAKTSMKAHSILYALIGLSIALFVCNGCSIPPLGTTAGGSAYITAMKDGAKAGERMAILTFEAYRWGDRDGERQTIQSKTQKRTTAGEGNSKDIITIKGRFTMKRSLTRFDIPLGGVSESIMCEKRWGGSAIYQRLNPIEIGVAPRRGEYLVIMPNGAHSILEGRLLGPLTTTDLKALYEEWVRRRPHS